jgi:hypothetical protein
MSENATTPTSERAIYNILKERIPALSYEEYLAAAKAVVAEIPPERVTPMAKLLTRLQQEILNRRQA